MKKSFNVVFVLLAVLAVFTGCASTDKVEKKSVEKTVSQKSKRFEIIDWNGAAFGSPAPADWMQYAEERDYVAFESSSTGAKVKNSFYVIVSGTRSAKSETDTTALKLLQENIAAQYATEIARGLNQAVEARFAGVLSDDEDVQQTLTATAAKAKFAGFTKASDGWILRQSKSDSSQYLYSYIAVYACDKDVWQTQVANYIKSFGANSKSENMKKVVGMAYSLAEELSDSKTFGGLSVQE